MVFFDATKREWTSLHECMGGGGLLLGQGRTYIVKRVTLLLFMIRDLATAKFTRRNTSCFYKWAPANRRLETKR